MPQHTPRRQSTSPGAHGADSTGVNPHRLQRFDSRPTTPSSAALCAHSASGPAATPTQRCPGPAPRPGPPTRPATVTPQSPPRSGRPESEPLPLSRITAPHAEHPGPTERHIDLAVRAPGTDRALNQRSIDHCSGLLEKMTIKPSHVSAVASVVDVEAAVTWYTSFFDRTADRHTGLAEWQLTGDAAPPASARSIRRRQPGGHSPRKRHSRRPAEPEHHYIAPQSEYRLKLQMHCWALLFAYRSSDSETTTAGSSGRHSGGEHLKPRASQQLMPTRSSVPRPGHGETPQRAVQDSRRAPVTPIPRHAAPNRHRDR